MIKKFLKELILPPKTKPLLLLLPLLALELIFFSIIQYKHGFALADHVLIVGVIQKLIFDSLLFLAVAMFLKFVTRINLPSVIFMIIYLYLVAQDMTVYFFGNTLFEAHFLDLMTWFAIKGFVNIYSIFLLLAFLGGSTAVFFIFRKISAHFKFSDFIQYSAILAFVILIDPTDFLIAKSEEHDGKFKGNEDKNIHYILRCKNEQIRYATKNSVINFVSEVWLKKRKANYKVLRTAESVEKTVAKYNLPLGKRDYEKLQNEPFNKVVWFASESISLDFFAEFNSEIPFATETSFYESDEFVKNGLTNYFTSASPTLQALTTTFSSHPNYDMILSGYHQNAIANVLKKHGYETIFLRSASKYYAGENIIFQKFGFKQIIAREYFSNFPENKDFIYDWGVSDRVMLDKLVDLLEEYKDKKLFVVVLGIDTHPPHGRSEYGFRKIKYPETPESYHNFGNAYKFMKSIYNHDFDMAQTLKTIKEKGLFTDDTLIIATADHSCPYNNVVKHIPGFENTNLGRTPLSFFTPAKLPDFNREILSSQLDLAPTVLHLLNIEIPAGYWGESIFSKNKKPLFVGLSRGVIEYRTDFEKMSFNKGGRSKEYSDFIKLFNSIIIKKEK
ncbi:MAG: LTA synthase family protein [bacterium]